MAEIHESSLIVEPPPFGLGTETDAPVPTESHLRSILKALSWRIVATCTTILLAWLVFGDVSKALAVGFFEFFLKFLIYYLHERAWQLAPRGSVRKWWSTK